MIDDRVEPQFVAHERAFVRPSHDADSTRALDPGDLADDRSHCAACRRDDHGFAGLGLADRQQPRISGEARHRSEEHTSELQSLMRISYAVFCLKKKKVQKKSTRTNMT